MSRQFCSWACRFFAASCIHMVVHTMTQKSYAHEKVQDFFFVNVVLCLWIKIYTNICKKYIHVYLFLVENLTFFVLDGFVLLVSLCGLNYVNHVNVTHHKVTKYLNMSLIAQFSITPEQSNTQSPIDFFFLSSSLAPSASISFFVVCCCWMCDCHIILKIYFAKHKTLCILELLKKFKWSLVELFQYYIIYIKLNMDV